MPLDKETKAKPIAEGRIVGCIPFLRVWVQYEMETAWSRIWTRVAVFFSYDDKQYIKRISFYDVMRSK